MSIDFIFPLAGAFFLGLAVGCCAISSQLHQSQKNCAEAIDQASRAVKGFEDANATNKKLLDVCHEWKRIADDAIATMKKDLK